MNRSIVRVPKETLEILLRGQLHGFDSTGPEDLKVIQALAEDVRYMEADYIELMCESSSFSESYSSCPIPVEDVRLKRTCG